MHDDFIHRKSLRIGKLIYGNKRQNHSYLWEQMMSKVRHERTLWGIGIYYISIWVIKYY